jgi:hypothetical protein
MGLLWVLGLLAIPAHAGVSVNQIASSAIAQGSPPTSFAKNDAMGTVVENTLMPPGSRYQAYGLADLSAGILRAAAVSDLFVGDSCCQYGTTRSGASISDTFSFSGVTAGQVASLDVLFEGTITRDSLSPVFFCCSDANHGAEGGLLVRVTDPFNQLWSSTQWLEDNGCWARSDPCTNGLAIQQVQHLVFPVMNGTYNLVLVLDTLAQAGYSVDFSNTARFYLSLPDNVTMQSGSGALFTTASPVAVPEPASALLALLGGCVVLKMSRRRSLVRPERPSFSTT